MMSRTRVKEKPAENRPTTKKRLNLNATRVFCLALIGVGVVLTGVGAQQVFHWDPRSTVVPYPPKGQFGAFPLGLLSILFGVFWFIRGRITWR
jgi:hypothetical protein